MPGVEFCEEKSSKVRIHCAHDVGPHVAWAGGYLSECVCVCLLDVLLYNFPSADLGKPHRKVSVLFWKNQTCLWGKVFQAKKPQQMSRFEWTWMSECLYFPLKNITNSPFSQIYCLVLRIFELCTFSPMTCFFPLLSIKFWVSFIVTCCCSSLIFLTASYSTEWAHHPLSMLWSAIFWVVFCLFTIIKNPAIKYILVYFSCKSFSLMLCLSSLHGIHWNRWYLFSTLWWGGGGLGAPSQVLVKKELFLCFIIMLKINFLNIS